MRLSGISISKYECFWCTWINQHELQCNIFHKGDDLTLDDIYRSIVQFDNRLRNVKLLMICDVSDISSDTKQYIVKTA